MRKNIKGIAAGGLGLLALQLPGMTVFAQAADMKSRMENALQNTVLGMGTVFAMLIAIAMIIYCFKIIPVIQKKFAKKEEPAAEAPKAAPVSAAPVQETDDLELVAVIAAAIAASENVPVDSFRVRTIKRR
ncbi:OadG family protein [uncultured Eubacterium sp.]|mgnify:FL=1|uniref:OadG family protein n=1 Tax=uncultured Eubacterium sp. TaxID=165185 RepID=UPI0025F7A526|nr:OadG family protein [uncultured Eubacterium sp.]MCI6537762.1 OadG family protein [Lachnospiraceae bacterium]